MTNFIKPLARTLTAVACAAGLMTATAAPIAPPAILAPVVGADVDVSYFYAPSGSSLAIELYDLVSIVDPLPIGTRFGIYFRGAPETLIPLFDVADEGPPTQLALINFTDGTVIDLDALVPQAGFTPSAAPFGFFMQTQGANPLLLYSDPGLNPAGFDFFAAFPLTALANGFVLDFTSPTLPAEIPGLQLTVMTGLAPVPLPPALMLMAPALLALGMRRRVARTA
ncbi:MAG: hypothetical protein IT178_14735 [Acidobacteria bacterium]|nr:hypothetical protein [Acidobacteriota bacterium]